MVKSIEDFSWGDDNSLRVRIAKTIYLTQVTRARERAAAHDLQIERLQKVFNAAKVESDRSAAILIFALAEDLMLEGLKANMNPQVKGGWTAVTDGNGVLATASNRIAILELLYWVRQATCNDIRLLKSIRNRFAHHADVGSFSDTKIAGWISSLSDRERPVFSLFDEDERKNWRKFTPRELYLMRSCAAVAQLVSDLAVGPAARAEQVSPGHVEGKDFGDLPSNLQEARRIIADVMIGFFAPP